jgi:hypothetical protein
MIFKKIGNMEDVEVICHYLSSLMDRGLSHLNRFINDLSIQLFRE